MKFYTVVDLYDKQLKNAISGIMDKIEHEKLTGNNMFINVMTTILVRNVLRYLDAVGENKEDFIISVQFFIESLVKASGGEIEIRRIY